MQRTTGAVLRIFLTGALAALPLAATVGIVWWAVNLLIQWLGPGSTVGNVLGAVGFGVTESEALSYLIGLGLVALMLFGLGLLVEAGLQRGLARLIDMVLLRIPLVRSIYELSRKVVGLVSERDAGGMQRMKAVWIHFGGPPAEGSAGGVAVLGLQSTSEPVMVDGRAYVGVIVPTAPVPVGGGLLFLPQAWVKPAGLGFEAVTSIYVSMGLTTASHLDGRSHPVPKAGAEPPQPSAPATSASQAP